MPSAFYAFLGFSNFNKKQALGTLEQSSLAVYALFLTMALLKRKSNSTRLTGKLTKELIMKKQKLRPGLNPELSALVSRIRLDRYRELETRNQDGLSMTDADWAELANLKPFFVEWCEKEDQKAALAPAPHRCLPEPISNDWDNYDEEG